MQRAFRVAFCGFTCSALSSQGALAAQLDQLVAKKRYIELDRLLPSVNTRDYFAGNLADRIREPVPAIALLEKVLPELKKTCSKRATEALRALANAYIEVGRYGDAADAYRDSLHNYGRLFNKAQKQGFSDNLRTYHLLRNFPSAQPSVSVSVFQNPPPARKVAPQGPRFRYARLSFLGSFAPIL